MLSAVDFEDLFPELFAPKAAAKPGEKAAPAAAEGRLVQTFPMRWFDDALSVGPLPQRHEDSERELVNG